MGKQVLIALAPAGSGHLSMAEGLADALIDLDPATQVRFLNPYNSAYCRFPIAQLPRLYNLAARHWPGSWGSVYAASNRSFPFRLFEGMVEWSAVPGLRRALAEHRPDAVVSTLPLINSSLAMACTDAAPQATTGVVIGDLVTVHAGWLARGHDVWYSVATPEAHAAVLAAGTMPNAVHLCGQPLRRAFLTSAPDRLWLRSSLGLPSDRPMVLALCTGIPLRRACQVARELLEPDLGIYAVIVAGDQGALQREIGYVDGRQARILGRVANIAEWMHAAELLVTKAGPMTIAEAIQCGLPMVITGAIPGQEEANIDLVAQARLGLAAIKQGEVKASVSRLLAEPGLAREMRENMAGSRRPDAGRRVAELVLRTAKNATALL